MEAEILATSPFSAERMSAHTDNERSEAAVDVPRLVRDYDSLSFQEQCAVAKTAELGSEWINRKSGKSAIVAGHSWREVYLKREGGRDTRIQHHYFAGDYFPANEKSPDAGATE